MRVLIVSQYFWPETFRINELALSLREAGCEVTVLTGQPNYPGGDIFPGYRALSAGCDNFEGIPIHRVPLWPRGKGGARNLALNYLSFLCLGSLLGPWLLRRQRFDVVFVYGVSPILQIFPAVVVRALLGGKLVTWVQDLWPESLEVTGFVRNRKVLAAVATVVRWLYRRNDLLLVQSHGFVRLVADMSGPTPVEYFPNPGEKAYEQAPQGPAALMLEPGFNVVFAGNLGTVQALDTLLQAAVLLRAHPDIRFVIVGSGSRSDWLRDEVARLQLANVQLAGRYPPEAMPGILAQAQAVLVSLVKGEVLNQTVPSKVQAYLATGRPIIASLDGEGARVVAESGAGRVCPAEDARALADAVLALHAMPAAEREALGAQGRRYYGVHFEPGALTQKLKARFEALLRKPASP